MAENTGPEDVHIERHHQAVIMKHGPEESTYDCGWFSWRPKLLSICNTSRWLLLCLSGLTFFVNLSVNGFTNVSITSIERRFELSSSETALIPVMYEIFSSVLIIVIGYFFAHGNKPRWIASGGVVVAIGCVVYTLPHFLTGAYFYRNESRDNTTNLRLCPNEETVTSCDDDSSTGGGSIAALSKYLYFFLLGQILLGLGNAPANALQRVFLDDSVKAKNIGMYLGIDGAILNLSSAVGFIAGGIFLQVLHTDFMQVNSNRLGLNPSDSQWVGAWWLGFLVCAVGAFLWSILISCFPPQMSGTETYHEERRGQEQKVAGLEKASEPDFGVTFRDIPAATLVIFRNPLYIFLILVNIADVSFLAGAEVFLPKFMELQFGLSAGNAAIAVGVIVTVNGCSAMLLGGWLIKRFNLTVSGMLKLCLGSSIACAIAIFGIFFRCAEIPLAGINVPYPNDNGMSEGRLDLEAGCNSHCNCSLSYFSPICSSQGVTYLSACHAGCEGYDQETNQYHDCSCISANDQTLKISPSDTVTVVSGTCSETCIQFYIFCLFTSAVAFTYFLTGIPRANVSLRCVPQRIRAYALSLNSLLVRLLASLPGPIIFGLLLDQSCLLWNEECGVRGRCLHYDRYQVAISILLFGLVMKVVATVCFIGTVVTYKPQGKAEPET